MPAHILWDRIERTQERMAAQKKEEHQRWVLGELMNARNIYFSLQADKDLQPVPPARGQKPKPPKKAEVEKFNRSLEGVIERHQEGIKSPYHYELYMGLEPTFPEPPPETVKTSKEFREKERQEVEAMKSRIVGRLDRIIDKHGEDVDFADIAPPVRDENPVNPV